MPRIQQIFKRWNGGQITLAAAAQNADTSSSQQMLDFSQLIETYREFVPNAGEKNWEGFYLLSACAAQLRQGIRGPPPSGR